MLHCESSLAGKIFRDRCEVRDVRATLLNEEGENARQSRVHVFSLPVSLFSDNASSFGSFPDTSLGQTHKRWVAVVFSYILKICTSVSKGGPPPFTMCMTFVEEIFSSDSAVVGWRFWVFDERPTSPGETLNQYLQEHREILEQMKSKSYRRHMTQVEEFSLRVHTHASFYEVAREVGGYDIRVETVDPKDTAYRSASCPTNFFSVHSPHFEIIGADPAFNCRQEYLQEDTIHIPVCHSFSPECLRHAFDFWTFDKQILLEDVCVDLAPTTKMISTPLYAHGVYANIRFNPKHPSWTCTKQALSQWNAVDFWVDLQTGLGVYTSIRGERDICRFAQDMQKQSITLVVRAARNIRRCPVQATNLQVDLMDPNAYRIEASGEIVTFLYTGEQSLPAFKFYAEEQLGSNIVHLERPHAQGSFCLVESFEDIQSYRKHLYSPDTGIPPDPGTGISAWIQWQKRWLILSTRADGTPTDTNHLGSLALGDVKQTNVTWQKAEYHYKDILLGHVVRSRTIPGSTNAQHFWKSYEEQGVHGSVSKHKVDQEYDENFLKRCVCTTCGKVKTFCFCQNRLFGIKIPPRKRCFGLNSVIGDYMVWFVEHLTLLGTPKSGPVSTSQIDWLNLSFIRVDAHRIFPDLHLMPYFTGAGATSKSHTFKGIVEMTLACEEVTRSTTQWLAIHQDYTSCKFFQHEAEQKVTGTQNRTEVDEAQSVLKTAITEGKVLSKNFVSNPNDLRKRMCITSVCDTRGMQIYAASNNPTGRTQFAMRRRRMEYQKNKVLAAKGQTVQDCQARQARMSEEERGLQADFAEFHILLDIMAHYLGDLTFLGLAHEVSVHAHTSLANRIASILKQNHGINVEVTQHEQIQKLARAICIVEALLEFFQGQYFTLPALMDPAFQSLLYIREEHTVAAFGLMSECIYPTNHRRVLEAVWDLMVSNHKSVKLHEVEDAGSRQRDPNWVSVGNGG